MHVKIGKTTAKWVDNLEVRINCVCQKCNNGWMSDIENENKPHMLPMMHGKEISLTPSQQKSLTRWAILKTMILDGGYPKRIKFYDNSERLGIKPPSPFFPLSTLAWLGRLSVKGFHAGLTDTSGKINHVPKAYRCCVVTIIVGHLVIQVITMHVLAAFASSVVRAAHKSGAWDVSLLDIWPVFGEARWPPPLPFTLDGSNRIELLIDRWKIGTNIG
jgi:hypothetical protein